MRQNKPVFFLFLIVFLSSIACPRQETPLPISQNPDQSVATEKTSFLKTESIIEKQLRPTILSKQGWMANTKERLQKQVDDFLAKVKLETLLKKKAIGLIVPHAGYTFSGQCAAYAFSAIKNQTYKRVIIMGPSHNRARTNFRGVSVTKFTRYETLLGEIPVDTEVCKELLAEGGLFKNVFKEEIREHSIEIELPFLQTVLKDCKIVPLLIGNLKWEDYAPLAESIQRFVDDDTLVVASSDFTHYGPNYQYVPFRKDIKENIKRLDDGAIKYVTAVDAEGFLRYIDKTGTTVCGCRPIALLLLILADSEGELLNYYTSGDITKDFTNSVSYAAMAMVEYQLNDAEQKTLLKLARDTLKSYLKDRKKPDIKNYELTSRLQRKRGIFVTLKNRGKLRGCIGRMRDPLPLYQGVIDYAINSANDSRFWHNPVTAKEEPELNIEISVLSSLKRVNSYKDIIVGKHGVYLVKGARSAVYLPQVAPEQGWDRTTMLSHLSRKAGLRTGAWQDKATKFYVFTAQVFGE